MAENRPPEQKRRRGRGRPFTKGASGNPGGRPRALTELRDAARGATTKAVDTLIDALDDADARVRIQAARELLDRGWGRAAPSVAEDDPGGALRMRKVAAEIALLDARLLELTTFEARLTALEEKREASTSPSDSSTVQERLGLG